MKFTKQEACEKLTAKLTNDGKKPLRMSAKTLESQTENLMTILDDDEMELDDFVGKVLPMLETTNSNVEHDVSKGIKDYEDKNPYKKSKKETKGTKEEEEEEDDEVSELKKQVRSLLDEKEERTKTAKVATIRSDIKKYLEDKNVKESEWIDDMLEITAISENSDVETEGERLLGLYNKHKADHNVTSPQFPGPDSKGDKKGLFDDLVEMAKARENYQ